MVAVPRVHTSDTGYTLTQAQTHASSGDPVGAFLVFERFVYSQLSTLVPIVV